MPTPPEVVIVNDDRRELAALETIFDQCKVAWLRGSEALAAIKERQLYRCAGFKNWHEYVSKRWGLGKSQADRKILMGKVANQMVAKISVDVHESHIAVLAGFTPDMRDAIFETAQQTAPGGKLTASWIEQTGRRLVEERAARFKEHSWKAVPPADEEELEREEEEAEEEEEEKDIAEGDRACPDAATAQPHGYEEARRSGSDRAIHDASAHKITMEAQTKKWEEQALRWVRKGVRLALALNCTPQDLLEKYGG